MAAAVLARKASPLLCHPTPQADGLPPSDQAPPPRRRHRLIVSSGSGHVKAGLDMSMNDEAGFPGVRSLGERVDQLVDAGVEDGDVRGQGVDAAQRKAWW